ncbi:MAG: agmatinase [bacterium]
MKAKKSSQPFAGCFASDENTRVSLPLVFVGLPDDSQSSFRRGSAKAPARIRAAYDGYCYNATTEAGVDLQGKVADFGDMLSEESWQQTAASYRTFVCTLLVARKVPFFAGGDHAVTVPVVAALATLKRPVHVIQFDAHPDLYPVYEGTGDSHACVAARLLEMKHVASVTQIGIRASNAEQAEALVQYPHRLRQYEARDLTGDLPALPHIPAGAAVYLTIDLDAFDPAFAPGVAHPVPGGLTPRQVLNFLQRLDWQVVGADVVEVNPELDLNDRTAILAARLLHQVMGSVWLNLDRSKPR